MNLRTQFLRLLAVATLVLVQFAQPMSAQAAATTSPVVQIDSSCIVLQDGNLDCWSLGATNGYRNTVPQVWINAPLRSMPVSGRVSQAANNCYLMIDQSVLCANDKALVPIGVSAISLSKGDQYNPWSLACAVTTGNEVVCWQGDGATGTFSTPTAVGISNAKQVVVGKDNSGCALLLSGEVQCWGWLGGVSGSATPTIMVIEPGHLVKSISAAWATACAITDDNTVWCWGDNSMGQTAQAIPAGSSSSFIFQSPMQVLGLADLKQVSVGQDPFAGGNPWGVETETCVLTNGGSVYCWGTSSHDAVGLLSGTSTVTPHLIAFPGSQSATLVSTNALHTCATTTDGSLYCWGGGGIYGCNTSTCSQPVLESAAADIPDAPFTPTMTSANYSAGVASASWQGNPSPQSPGQTSYQMTARFSGATASIVEMSTTSWSRCAVLSDGTVACWGDNFWYGFTPVGKFGTSSTRYSNVPVLVPGITNAVQVAIGIDFACAVLADSTVVCWGLNNHGQLGQGLSATQNDYTINSPTQVTGLPNDVSQISAREGGICALIRTLGTVYCWGQTALGDFTTPTQVPGISGAVKISYGNDWTCVVINDGSVKCWGHGRVGVFGDGSPDYNSTPTTVQGLSRVVDVYAMDQAACALEVDGAVLCWGTNASGELGNGFVLDPQNRSAGDSMSPQLVINIPKATTLGGNEHGACIADVHVQVYCWGWVVGPNYSTPIRVPELDGSIALSGGFYTTCGLTQVGTAGCIGDNTAGEMGSGNYGDGGNFTPMTNDVVSMCETTLNTCSVATPPGATSVTISVQASNANGASYPSNSQTFSITAPTGVTQINNTNLGAAANQNIPLSATSTSAGASFTYSTATAGCSVVGASLTSTTPAICEVTATSTAPVPALSTIRGSGVLPVSGAAPQTTSSHSTNTRFLFTGTAQSSVLAMSGSTTSSSNIISLASSGGSGSGQVSYFASPPSCRVNGSVLSVTGSNAQICIVFARKEGDTAFDSSLSAPVNLTLNYTPPMPFSTAVRTRDGFSFNFTSYDRSFSYRFSTSAGSVRFGRAVGANLPLAVSGLEPGQLAKVTVVASKTGTQDATFNMVSGATSRLIALSKPVPTVDGFIFSANKLDVNHFNYVPVITGGSGVIATQFTSSNSAAITVKSVDSESAKVRLQQIPKQPDPGLPNAYWSDASLDPEVSSLPLPVVTGSVVSQSRVGGSVFILGTHLWETTAVYLGGVKAPKFTVLSDGSVQVGIWDGAKSGKISVVTPSGSSTGSSFVLANGKANPTFTSLSSNTASVGASIEVVGTNLGSSQKVLLGRTSVPFHLVGDGKVVIDIPTGVQVGSYQISIVTTAGSLRVGQIAINSAVAIPTVSNGPFTTRSGNFIYVFGVNLGGVTQVTLAGDQVKNWAVYGSDLLAILAPVTLTTGTTVELVFKGWGGTSSVEHVTISG